jgi:hypothetical protein
VTKGKNLCVEVGTVLKGELTRAKNATKNSVHGGSEHDPHKDHDLCVSSSDGVFRTTGVGSVSVRSQLQDADARYGREIAIIREKAAAAGR